MVTRYGRDCSDGLGEEGTNYDFRSVIEERTDTCNGLRASRTFVRGDEQQVMILRIEQSKFGGFHQARGERPRGRGAVGKWQQDSDSHRRSSGRYIAKVQKTALVGCQGMGGARAGRYRSSNWCNGFWGGRRRHHASTSDRQRKERRQTAGTSQTTQAR